MNQVDKELMQEKGILTENEKADEYEIQKAAMKEAVFFLAAMLEKNLDMSELQTISLYLKELFMKQHYMHIHLYVQQLYRNSRPHEKLETFYAASLQEEAQRMYSTYFVAYLKMLIGRLSEMDDLINLKKLMKEEENRE